MCVCLVMSAIVSGALIFYLSFIRSGEATMAVFRLSDLLAHSKKIGEVPPKKGTKNQKQFTSMLKMSLDNIKMAV